MTKCGIAPYFWNWQHWQLTHRNTFPYSISSTDGGNQMRHFAFVLKLASAFAGFKLLFAYLDPGSGSLIVQLLIAIVVGILATLRFWKSRLLSLFGIRQEMDEDDDKANED